MTGGEPPYREFRREAAPILDREADAVMTMPLSEIRDRFGRGWTHQEQGSQGRTILIDGVLLPLGGGDVRVLLTASTRLEGKWSEPVGGRFVEIRGDSRETGTVFVERWIDEEVLGDMARIAADMRKHRRRRWWRPG